MGKDKKSGQRLKKKDLQGLLMDMFQQAPGETFDLKTLYRTLNLKTHPAKMLMMDVLDEMLMDDYIKEHPRYHFSLNTPSQVMEGTFRRKANGKQREWEERYNAKRKAQVEAAKAAIRAEDMEKGVFIPVSQLPRQEPRKATLPASAAV